MQFLEWQQEAYLDATAKYNIIPAGRRTGKTKGGCNGAIIDAANGLQVLWVDTIYSNIDRYYERYFLPELKKTNVTYSWNVQKKLLKVGTGYIDFRSADRPESIEGFGYHSIYLNEAGIILNNDYLYTNAILPMLMDFKESRLFAFGTPKGKTNKKGDPHKFHQLWQKVEAGAKGYAGVQLSSYDNTELDEESIVDLEGEMRDIGGDSEVQQEIYGKFVDAAKGKVYTEKELTYFKLSDLKTELIEHTLQHIDPATTGVDYLSSSVGDVIGKEVFITDVVFSPLDTNYTMPMVKLQIDTKKPQYVWIENNGAGGIYATSIQGMCPNTTILDYHQSANKHAKIISRAPFVKRNFRFRDDYEVGSDYDLFMKNLLAYNRDEKLNKSLKDDGIDDISELAKFIQLYLVGNW